MSGGGDRKSGRYQHGLDQVEQQPDAGTGAGEAWADRPGPPAVQRVRPGRREVDVVSVQNRYNLGDREHEAVLDHCEREGIAFIPWLPIPRRPLAALDAVAAETGATVTQVALAWLLHRSPAVAPIPGTSRPEHMEENVAARELRLTADQFDRLSVAGAV